jgi:hypothetical protein
VTFHLTAWTAVAVGVPVAMFIVCRVVPDETHGWGPRPVDMLFAVAVGFGAGILARGAFL